MSDGNGYLGRDALLSFKRTIKDIAIPSGGVVRIQDFNNAEHEDFQIRTMDSDGNVRIGDVYSGYSALLIARAVVADNGERIFSDSDTQVIQEQMPPDVIEFLRDEIIEHTGLFRNRIESQKKS